ncbi:TPA: hypothetical protein ROY17_005513 [Bacillus thuringiensis]|nr:hypothetical protein [Bacillus thuringiensis]
MKKQVKILLTAGMIMSPAFLTSIVPLPGIGIHAYANTVETFDKVEMDLIDKSKEVIKKETEAWKKDLKSDVKTTIESICKESDLKTITKINTELRQGDEAKSKDTIEKLDAALRAAPVTKEETKVYIDVSLKNDFGVSKDNVKTGETVITENGYIKGSLVRNTSASTSEVIELTIPKGEHMANMTPSGSNTLSYNELLERGYSFIITAKKEIKDMGKTRTKIEAVLLPKELKMNNIFLDFGKNIEQADKWGLSSYETWLRDLSDSEISAIKGYTFGDHKAINHYLRGTFDNSLGDFYRELNGYNDKYSNKDIDELTDKERIEILETMRIQVQKQIKEIDVALEKGKIPNDLKVYRRANGRVFNYKNEDLQDKVDENKIDRGGFEKFKSNLLGSILKENGYMSTALIKDPPNGNFDYKPILLALNVPKGVNGAYLYHEDVTEYPNEKEMLLKHGYEFKIINIELMEENNREYIEIEADIINN